MKNISRPAFATLSLVVTLVAAATALAQGPGTIDSTYNPNVDGTVFCHAVQPDGKIIIAGGFTNVGGNPGYANIVRLNTDGTVDNTFFATTDSVIFAVAVQTDGSILIGGVFTTVNGTSRSRIARLSSTGVLDGTFDPNPVFTSTPANTEVSALCVQTDGKILFGGNFNTVQPNGAPSATTRNGLARVNSDGTLDNGFNPNPGNGMATIALQGDGKILIGGFFASVGGSPRNKIARLNTDGSIDAGFDPNAGSAGYVLNIIAQADGKILLGGGFTSLQPNGAPSPTTRNYIARVNSDGTLDSTFDPNANAQVDAITVQADGRILFSGNFQSLQPNGANTPTTRNYVARLNSDGTVDTGFDPNASNTVFDVALQPDGKVLLGGSFTTLQPNGAPSTTTRNHFA